MNTDLASKKCVPCEGTEEPFTRAQAEDYLNQINDWELVDPPSRKASEGQALKIRKRFKFGKYMQGIEFINKVAKIAEEEGHHPNMLIGWRQVTINLSTHAIGGLSENDFIMAAKIDKISNGIN